MTYFFMDELTLPLEFYTIAETAKMLNTRERNVKSMIQNGILETVNVSGMTKVTKASIDSVLPNQVNESNPDVKKDTNPHKNDNVRRNLSQR